MAAVSTPARGARASWSRTQGLGTDQRLDCAALGHISERLIRSLQCVRNQFHARPGFGSVLHDLSSTIEVRKLRSPASTHIKMFFVQIEMRIEFSSSVIC